VIEIKRVGHLVEKLFGNDAAAESFARRAKAATRELHPANAGPSPSGHWSGVNNRYEGSGLWKGTLDRFAGDYVFEFDVGKVT
jgi:hypothetical protein